MACRSATTCLEKHAAALQHVAPAMSHGVEAVEAVLGTHITCLPRSVSVAARRDLVCGDVREKGALRAPTCGRFRGVRVGPQLQRASREVGEHGGQRGTSRDVLFIWCGAAHDTDTRGHGCRASPGNHLGRTNSNDSVGERPSALAPAWFERMILARLRSSQARTLEVRCREVLTHTAGLLVTTLMPMAMPGGAALSGVSVASMFPVDMSMLKCLGVSDMQALWTKEVSMEGLERGVLVATFVQGSLGLLRICLGDVFNGAYILLLATLGFNARHPGPASNWLKTYVLISFINGTMGSIDLLQNILIENYPVILPSLPLAVNLAHALVLVVPPTSLLGAYCGWQHIKVQRRMAFEASQMQLLAMLQFPPPPLLPQLPGLPGLPGMPGAATGAREGCVEAGCRAKQRDDAAETTERRTVEQ